MFLTFLSSNDFASAFAANWLNVIIAVILVFGGSGGVIAFLRLRKESPKILVDAAQGAVVVQSGVIKDLRKEIEDQKSRFEAEGAELRAEVAELRTHLAELNSLRTRMREVEQQNEILHAENTMLKSQVKALTKMIQDQEDKRNG